MAAAVLPLVLGLATPGLGQSPPTTAPTATQPTSKPAPPSMPDLSTFEFRTTDSGLKVCDLAPGEGDDVTSNAFIEFRFKSWLENGTWWRGTPEGGPGARLPVTGTRFVGWSEGVAGMKPGGRRLLVIPPNLAFGEGGAPGVPGNSTIVMDVEVVRILVQITPTDPSDLTQTASGLRYADLKVGDGESPEPDSQVTVHFSGWLEDGTLFDSSVARGRPNTVPLEEVIDGWQEGLLTMKVGGKRKLIVPPSLAFGERGAMRVPPNATLIYEVELLAVEEATQPAPVPPTVRATPKPRKPPEPVPLEPKDRDGMPELP
jgi:peptidylprolyl isomerase